MNTSSIEQLNVGINPKRYYLYDILSPSIKTAIFELHNFRTSPSINKSNTNRYLLS